MAALARWAWALLAPPAIMASLVAILPERGMEGVFWLGLAAAVLIGTLAFASAEWPTATKVLVIVPYVPIMGIAVLVSTILTACYVHGCH
jgi:hypothetical protein